MAQQTGDLNLGQRPQSRTGVKTRTQQGSEEQKVAQAPAAAAPVAAETTMLTYLMDVVRQQRQSLQVYTDLVAQSAARNGGWSGNGWGHPQS